MASNNEQYTIPFAIDPRQLLTGLDQMDQGLTDITTKAKSATAAIADSFATGAKASNDFTAKMVTGADAAQKISDAAKEAGVNLANTFHPDNTAKVVALRTQLVEIKNQLAQMTLNGQEGSKAFLDLSLKAARLNTVYKETSEALTNLGSKTKGLNALIEGVRGLAGVFSVAEGALAAFGATNEDAAVAIQKVQGAMALLMGVQEVANVLQKDSALMIYLSTFAHKAQTEAVVAETVAIEGDVVATEAATVATEGWTAALLANPIVAVIALLAGVVAAVYAFSKSQDQAGLSADQFNKRLELQKELLDQELEIANRRKSFETAQSEFERKNESDRQQIALNALKEQKAFNQEAFNEASENQTKLNTKDKDYEKSKEAINKQLNDLDKERSLLNSQIDAADLLLQKQVVEEKIKLEGDFLKERQLQLAAEVEIAKQAENFLNQIRQANIAELRDGEQKEISVLNQALVEKIQTLNNEQKAKLKSLEDQKANLIVQRALADENGKKLIDQQVADLTRQITLTTANGKIIKDLELKLNEERNVAVAEINKKYAEQRADIEFQVATSSLNLQEETSNRQIAIITVTAQHEIDVIERTNQDRNLKDLQQQAIEKKRDQDVINAQLEFALKRIEIEKAVNDDKLKNLKVYLDNSRDAQAAFHLLEAKNELEAAQKAVLALEASDARLTAQQVADADARVKAAKKAVKDATKDVGPQSLAELFFPNDDDAQKRFNNAIAALGEVGKAVDAYTTLLVANYQKQIDAQKAVVSNDDDALTKLQDQLKTEQDLKSKGYANNVDGIQKEIAAKNKQRDDDIRKQQDYQTKMEAIQRRALVLQSAIQAANLITASSKIFLASADLGPVGVGISIVAVAAMIAAFVATQAQAFNAINNEATTMAEGGLVKGKSHAQGGQRYYSPDSSVGVVELEGDEFVTSKRQTEKYFPLLQVINDDKLKNMDDRTLFNLLAGLGVHLQTDGQHQDILAEAKEYATHQVNQINVTSGGSQTPEELISINKTLQMMLLKQKKQVTITEEGGYIVTRKGNYTKRVKIK